jgi:hypothetical protein
MKPGSMTASRLLLAMLTLTTMFVFISWDNRPTTDQFQHGGYFRDTIPKDKKVSREKKIRDLDDVIDEMNAIDLQKEMEKANIEMQKAMKDIDGQKLKMQLDEAMKQVDMEKMQKEWKESMANMNVDMEKMKKEIEQSMKEFDAEKIKAEVDKAMKQVDFEKLQKDMNEEMAKVDWKKWEKDMQGFKNMDMSKVEEEIERAKKEMEKIGPQLEKEMSKAKLEIDKAKTEMNAYKGFVDGLDKDGLIKKDQEYTIKHADGELIINGKKASQATYLKYKSFLDKHPKFKIEKSDDDFNIDVD